jgi:hypothetical protein
MRLANTTDLFMIKWFAPRNDPPTTNPSHLMRAILGTFGALALIALIAVLVFGSMFASGWEGGHGGRGPAWENLGIVLLAYPIYCVWCAVVQISARSLLVSGVIMHSILIVYFGFCIAYGHETPKGLILLALIIAAVWLTHYQAVCRRSTSNETDRYDEHP